MVLMARAKDLDQNAPRSAAQELHVVLIEELYIFQLRYDKRYAIVAAAFLTQSVVIGCMFAYGVFFEVLETELGWSRTLLSGCSSLAVLVMGSLAIFGGRLSDRFGPRWVLSASGLCFGLGYALMFYMTAPWHLFVLYGLLIGAGLSTHDVVTLSTIARWFKRRRGMMTGVVKVGTACGQIIVPLVAASLIAAFGWRVACVVLGGGAAALLVFAAQGMRPGPQDGEVGGSIARSVAQPDAGEGLSLSFSEAVRTRQFWTLCAAQFTFFPSLVTIPVHIVAHGTDLGLRATGAAAVLSVIGAVSIVGRMTVGAAVDRIRGRCALLICFTVLLASLLLLRLVDVPWMLFVFGGLYGFAHGGFFTVVSPTVAEFFGMGAHGAIFGVVLFSGTLGGALGPLIAGRVFDTSGSYDMAFLGLALMALIGLLLVRSLRPLTRTIHEMA